VHIHNPFVYSKELGNNIVVGNIPKWEMSKWSQLFFHMSLYSDKEYKNIVDLLSENSVFKILSFNLIPENLVVDIHDDIIEKINSEKLKELILNVVYLQENNFINSLEQISDSFVKRNQDNIKDFLIRIFYNEPMVVSIDEKDKILQEIISHEISLKYFSLSAFDFPMYFMILDKETKKEIVKNMPLKEFFSWLLENNKKASKLFPDNIELKINPFFRGKKIIIKETEYSAMPKQLKEFFKKENNIQIILPIKQNLGKKYIKIVDDVLKNFGGKGIEPESYANFVLDMLLNSAIDDEDYEYYVNALRKENLPFLISYLEETFDTFKQLSKEKEISYRLNLLINKIVYLEDREWFLSYIANKIQIMEEKRKVPSFIFLLMMFLVNNVVFTPNDVEGILNMMKEKKVEIPNNILLLIGEEEIENRSLTPCDILFDAYMEKIIEIFNSSINFEELEV